MELKKISEDDYTIIGVKGELDASSAILLDEALSECISNGDKKIFVNAEQLEYISSAGLGVFASHLNEFTEKGIKFCIYNMKESVLNVFEILGLDQLLIICKDLEAAKEKAK